MQLITAKTVEPQNLVRTLPADIADWLTQQVPNEVVRFSQYVDLHGPGHFGSAWVVATDKSLVAMREDADGLKLAFHLPFEDIESVELREFVGNGRLEVLTPSGKVAVARFTRSRSREIEEAGREFARIATEHRTVLGRPAVELVGDIIDRTAARCAICGRVLNREGVCEQCLDRQAACLPHARLRPALSVAGHRRAPARGQRHLRRPAAADATAGSSSTTCSASAGLTCSRPP